MAKDKTEEEERAEIAERLKNPTDPFHEALAKIGKVRKEDVDRSMENERLARKDKRKKG